MPSLLVYLPGKQGADAELLRSVGLGDLLDGGAVSFFQADRGPDAAGGAVAYWGHELPRIDDYEFAAAKGGKAFWLGKPKAGRFAPEDLARPKLQLGADVVLADGQAWHVPVARQLPQLLGLNDAGEWTGVVVPQYRRFYDEAWAALDWLAPTNENVCRVDAQRGADFAALALSINYRINRDVAAFLGLLTSESIFEIARVVVEFEAIVAAQKKAFRPTTLRVPPLGRRADAVWLLAGDL